jgi:hypothetical protein
MLELKPIFAVVGHPNKGKSSIVSTLTRQDAVKVSAVSGTTTQAQSFKLIVDDVELYTLVDTPGFQRPRQLLDGVLQRSPNASERKQAMNAFLDQTSPEVLVDEKELLSPILKGAGILYVVDGSIPYSPEFEAEMTLLQWTGQPRMALINPIGGEQYIEQWRAALSQFFSVVRVFDPMSVDQQKQASVLAAFAELHEPWRPNLENAVAVLSDYQKRLDEQGATIVVDALLQQMMNQTELKVPAVFAENLLHEQLKTRYQQALRDIESTMQRQLQNLFAHPQMTLKANSLIVDAPDLFDHSHWYLYGLDRQKIIGLSTSAGMAAGAVIDVGVGGTSLMTGALAGGVVSSIASAIATWKPEKLNIKGVPLAGKMLLAGPVKDLTFSYVLLGRAIEFFQLIRLRTHADRSIVDLSPTSMKERLHLLTKVDQIKLTRLLMKGHKGLDARETAKLKEWVLLLTLSESPND